MSIYKVERTVSTIYLDTGGSPVKGFLIYVYFPEFNETHEIEVPGLDPRIIAKKVELLLAQRQALAAMGEE